MSNLVLSGVPLNPNMELPFLNQSFGIVQRNMPTLAGGTLIFQRAIKSGVAVQLIATDDQGWLDKDQRDSLLQESLIVGKVHILSVAGTHYNVVYDHSDGAAVSLEPFVNRLVPLDGDYFKGIIKLITV